jgi:hypothetical protein
MTVDFQNVADRLTIFGIALKKRLADMAGVPESALRLTDLRPGSIIAEFLVLPNIVDDLHVGSPSESIELLRKATYQNWAELCGLSGATLEGCNIDVADLGVARPSTKGLPVPKQHAQQQQEQVEADEATDMNTVIMVVGALIASWLLIFAIYRAYMALKKRNPSSSPESYETKVETFKHVDSMEEGRSMPVVSMEPIMEEKQPVEQEDDRSTVCPSISDKQSDQGPSGDAEIIDP